jgi:hypothetical protein
MCGILLLFIIVDRRVLGGIKRSGKRKENFLKRLIISVGTVIIRGSGKLP